MYVTAKVNEITVSPAAGTSKRGEKRNRETDNSTDHPSKKDKKEPTLFEQVLSRYLEVSQKKMLDTRNTINFSFVLQEKSRLYIKVNKRPIGSLISKLYTPWD